MAETKQLNMILIVRNDSTTNWASTTYRLKKGELGIGYLDNGNIIVKCGAVDEENSTPENTVMKTWADCPQVEGVFEEDITLTHTFGRHKIPAQGFIDAGGAGMTTSQWIVDALSEIKTPTITQPKIELSASPSGHSEIGSYITTLNWTATYTDGQYEFGSTADNSSNTRKNTGLTISDYVWSVSNSITDTTQTSGTEKTTQAASVSGNKPLKQTETNSFALGDSKIQVTQEGSKTYATITANYTRPNTNARIPVNNVGGQYSAGVIPAISTAQTLTANVNASSYRKPFWGTKTTSINIGAITSAQVRALGNGGTQNKGFPTTLSVPEGSTQVIFCAKAGVYSSLTATDALAQNATVTFTKVANAVSVEGANGFAGTNYDLWHVTWPDPIASAKSLNLTWT